MNTRTAAALLVLLGALCTTSYAGEPTVKVVAEPAKAGAVIAPDQWFDLLVQVDPGGMPLQAGGTATASGEGTEFDAAIWPAPDGEGVFTKPFVVRVPARLTGPGKRDLAVKLAAGDLSLEASVAVKPDAMALRHVKAKAKLKSPAVAGKANAVVVEASVIEGYHVYGGDTEDGLSLETKLLPAPGTRGAPPFTAAASFKPPGDKLHGSFTFEIPFTPTKAGKQGLRVYLFWQACTETLCDPFETDLVPLSFEVAPAEGTVGPVEDAGGGPGEGGPPRKAPDEISGGRADASEGAGAATGDTDGLAGKSLWELLFLAIGGGLFALAMPCTYPLIPITISFFTKQAEQRHGKVTGLAVAYGAGIVGVFILVGVAFGPAIIRFAAWWPVNAVFALLFLVFGLSLVGLFEIRLPGVFNDIAAKASGTGGYLSVFAMGTTLVITSFTCTAPIIGLVLVFSADGGSLWTVAFTMGVFGLTMAIPFVFLSLAPGAIRSMPRSGEWMKTLKVTLGIVELGLVLKFVSNMDLAWATFWIDRELFLWLWGASFGVAALYVFGVFSLFVPGARWSIGKGRAIAGVFLVAVTAYLYSGTGGRVLDKRLEAFLPQIKSHYTDAFLAEVKEDFEAGVRKATELGAPIFVDFTGFQ